jgi:hypothetical protein
MKLPLLLAAGVAVAPAAAAAQSITITIPQIKTSEYHNPYVAIWLEPADGGPARMLAVWCDVKMWDSGGTKWLADLRVWWRKGGRSLTLPADGVSGATRAPGAHRIILPKSLAPGAYTLYVEAAREAGGREMLSVPLTIPNPSGSATGVTELGAVTIDAR